MHGTDKLLAFTSDVTPRYVKANPVEGGKQAVAEAYRNLSALGAKPLATTDNLNFGNPEKPEIMGQFVGAIKGIGAAVAALDMPIVSGNVSLYNETDGTGDPADTDHRRRGPDRAQRPRSSAMRARAMWPWCWAKPRAIWASRRCWPKSSTASRATRRTSIWRPRNATAISSAPTTR